MNNFKNYARYYDLFYRDKNYSKEVKYINGLLKKWNPKAQEILELGCGTGSHAILLSEKGYSIHGIDVSPSMLKRAQERYSQLSDTQKKNIKFSMGDLRSVKINKKFDAVISLFHVMSYQTSNSDLYAAFLTAYRHLKPNGVFIFDCWYGPAVLANRPKVRIKEMEDRGSVIRRISTPLIHPNENIVDVKYKIHTTNKANGSRSDLKEIHSMRYLFQPEIEFFLNRSGFELKKGLKWMTHQPPGFQSWYACFVCKKK